MWVDIYLMRSKQKDSLVEAAEHFDISIGKLEDQLDLFLISGLPTNQKNSIYMQDGMFYLANGNQQFDSGTVFLVNETR